MKLNFSYPINGSQKLVDFDDEKRTRVLIDKRISQEIDGGAIGEEYKGYVFRIAGGNDKQGFAMMQGVLHPSRVRLLLDDRHPCYRTRRTGERKRKSVRGCIVAQDIAVCNLIVVKKGEKEIEGLTDRTLPRRLGPKRASKIRKLFALKKADDVRKYIIRREVPAREASEDGKVKAKKAQSKAAKIQRLVTPVALQRKRHRLNIKKTRSVKAKEESAAFSKLVSSRLKEQHEKREERLSKRREERQSNLSAGKAAAEAAAPAAAAAKKDDKKAAAAPSTAAPAKKDEKKTAAAVAPAATKAAATTAAAPKKEEKKAAPVAKSDDKKKSK
eukprot:c8775_g1_i1.p1 GENE.c8775_g1_i1~~c8775_g1_i1.p1  ORF type:complete len:329 (+),score=53.99 c8775_g1_i1:43-1029(+)